MRYDVKLPDIDSKKTSDEKLRSLIEYVYALQKTLNAVLTNIDTDNMTEKVSTVIQQAVDASGPVNGYVTTDNYTSYISQTAQLIQSKVAKDSVISTINQSAEEVAIDASKISLTGYVSINETFSVDTSGFLIVTGGRIGGFNIGTTGQYLGTNSADVAPTLYWGNADILKATEITDSGARKDWRFKIGAKYGVTVAGALYCQEGHFRGNVDAGSVTYGAGNTMAGDALTNYTINVNKISSHTIDASAMETAYATMKANIATVLSYFNGTISADSFYCGDMHAASFYLNGHRVVTNSILLDGAYRNVLTWS